MAVALASAEERSCLGSVAGDLQRYLPDLWEWWMGEVVRAVVAQLVVCSPRYVVFPTSDLVPDSKQGSAEPELAVSPEVR